MSNRLIIRQRAEIQITEAFTWYENKQSDLGNDFLISLEDSLTIIELNPQAFQLKYKHIRVIYIKRFPFGIFYSVEKERIVVILFFT
ncbi:MAG: type II toxin-antitoxin system RelE/ParE family toxin [Bacteroidota bacterium]